MIHNFVGNFGGSLLLGYNSLNTSSRNTSFQNSTFSSQPSQSAYLDDMFMNLNTQLAIVNLVKKQNQNWRPRGNTSHGGTSGNHTGGIQAGRQTTVKDGVVHTKQGSGGHHPEDNHTHEWESLHHQHPPATPPPAVKKHVPHSLNQRINGIKSSMEEVQKLQANQYFYENTIPLYLEHMNDMSNTINDYYIIRDVHMNGGRIIAKYDDHFLVEDDNQGQYSVSRI